MPSFFDEFLKSVPVEDKAVLDKYPQLKQYTTGWETWQQQNWDPQSGMTFKEKELNDTVAALTAQLSHAPAAGASAAEIANLRKELDTKISDLRKQSSAEVEGMHMFYRGATKHILGHKDEFGKNLDPQELVDFITKNADKPWARDVDMAYDQMVSGMRAEKSAAAQKELEAKHAADIEAAVQRGRELAAQERVMGTSSMSPTDQTGGIAGITAVMGTPAKVSDEIKAKIAEAKLGDGTLPNLGYDLWRQGAFSGQAN